MLTIYNSLTKQKEPFTPIQPNQVGIYVCGMTVYDYCHLGHARSMVAFDMIVRYLRTSGYVVNYVSNITDIDDKIIQRAQERGEDWQALTAHFITAMQEDFQALNILAPDHAPKATDHIQHMIALIQTLIDKGYAYQGETGDVYYHVPQFPDYGQLARKDIEGQEAGARIDVVAAKRHPLDFVLWKQAKPGEPEWDSPWGKGRPGWHTECSSMAMDYLGHHFDIHGGGFDLQFPHHENEIAQSEAVSEEKLANYWMHVGYLQINRQKMSKSLGNFFTIREILTQYPAETVRYFLLSSHYRSQLNYSVENLEIAQRALMRFYTALRGLNLDSAPAKHEFLALFTAAMDDDFNTPEALAVMFDVVREINSLRESDPERANALGALLVQLGEMLGILQQAPNAFLHAGTQKTGDTQAIEQLISEREQARAAKDWIKADTLRDQLHQLGVELEDKAGRTIWRRGSIHTQGT